jgi:hypothetical protein
LRFRLFVAAALVVALATLSAASLSTASLPGRPSPLDPDAFEVIAGTDLAAVAGTTSEPQGSIGPPPVIVDPADPTRSFPARPEPSLLVRPNIVVPATPRPQGFVASSGNGRVSGTATWYCLTGVSACHYAYSGGMYAAAGPGLRVGNWRGRAVRVCGNGRCVTVKLIDWCACPGSRVIDLYSDAFQRLAPLNSGTVQVTVTW